LASFCPKGRALARDVTTVSSSAALPHGRAALVTGRSEVWVRSAKTKSSLATAGFISLASQNTSRGGSVEYLKEVGLASFCKISGRAGLLSSRRHNLEEGRSAARSSIHQMSNQPCNRQIGHKNSVWLRSAKPGNSTRSALSKCPSAYAHAFVINAPST
jgi:hypothetical protein